MKIPFYIQLLQDKFHKNNSYNSVWMIIHNLSVDAASLSRSQSNE